MQTDLGYCNLCRRVKSSCACLPEVTDVPCTHVPFGVSNPQSCIDAQQGGTHYQQGTIQPIEYIHANDLNFFEGNCIKYVTRNRRKGSPVDDLKKALHYIQLQLKLEYGIDSRIEYHAVSGD